MTRARDLAAFVSNADGDIKFDTDTLFIDSSANRVAIGNTAPSRPLHITANPAMILLEDSDGGSDDKKAQIQVDGGVFEVNARNDDDSSRTDNIFVADLGTGDIGIGTNNPQYGRLHIADGNSDIAMGSNGEGQLHIDGNGYGFGVALNANGAQLYTNSASRDLIFGVNETEVARVTDDGLTFNGDTAAANALDDYEEGTWTPDIKLVSASSTSSTYSTRSGEYTRIGNLCTVSCVIYNTAHSGTGTAYIHGLPFTHATSAESIGSAQMNTHSDSWSTNIGAINSIIQSGESTIHMRATYNTNTTGPLYIPLQNFTYLRITITYRTA
jgi:hypothetical protein